MTKQRCKFERVLKKLKHVKYSNSALELLLGTCAVESNYGKYKEQIGGGPAKGILQIEPESAKDLFINYLVYREDKLKEVLSFVDYTNEYDVFECIDFDYNNIDDLSEQLKRNDDFSIVVARYIYLRKPRSLPQEDNLDGLAEYWKEYYNTYLGAGTIEHFKSKYRKYVNLDY